MKINKTCYIQTLGVVIAVIVVVFPAMMLMFQPTIETGHQYVPFDTGAILLRTFLWAFSVGVLATAIGWPIGLRISTLRNSSFSFAIITLIMTLAIPAYAVYYVWWQSWPSGSALHKYIVLHNLLPFAMKACVLLALVGWSWPIPAIISAATNRGNAGLLVLHRIDGTSLLQRCIIRIQSDKKFLFTSVVLVAALAASNTTCFDLAQIATIGNELRAVVASSGSSMSAPLLSFSSVLVAALASFVVFRTLQVKRTQTQVKQKSIIPIVLAWSLLSGGPLFMSAYSSLRGNGIQLWSHYGGDVLVSTYIALSVAIVLCLLAISSMFLHLEKTNSQKIKSLANILDFVWILIACLPASLVASAVGSAWHAVNFEFLERSPFVLVLAQVAQLGFVGSLAGRWAASCPKLKILQQLDSTTSIRLLLTASKPRVLQAICITFAIAIAMSFGEVALTSQLAPPSTSHPIAVALLNAMHYQRSQIVTSALFVMIALAAIGWLVLVVLNRKVLVAVLFLSVLASCQSSEEKSIPTATIIGSAGYSDNHFMTPRAIASDENTIVVIDKSGRLQRFDADGIFLSAWDLELSGTGFPTGVSIDDKGDIWIADTHQHRVLVLDSDGNEVRSFGEYGTGDGQFLYPTDVAFGIDGEVYVSEYGGNDRINVFDR